MERIAHLQHIWSWWFRGKPPSTFDLINSDLRNVCSEFGGSQVFNLPGSVCGVFLVKSQDQLDKGSWRALKNSTVNADGDNNFSNGKVD